MLHALLALRSIPLRSSSHECSQCYPLLFPPQPLFDLQWHAFMRADEHAEAILGQKRRRNVGPEQNPLPPWIRMDA
jgi:hypothetical protein